MSPSNSRNDAPLDAATPPPANSRSFKLTLAYDGTDYAGWQVQPHQPTIQATVQSALATITGETVQVIGSGRTDSGVHAFAQVASCTIGSWRSGAHDLMRAINAHLPASIVVNSVDEAVSGFHAIRDATAKRYRYQLQLGGQRDVFEHRYRWHLRQKLDLDAIHQAAAKLTGRHDFASFQASGADPRITTTRNLRVCQLIEQPTGNRKRQHWAIEVEADGFLYNMVRNIVGTLMEVGRGRQPPEWIDEVLAARNRNVAGPTAPAHALFLVRVDYPDHLFLSAEPVCGEEGS